MAENTALANNGTDVALSLDEKKAQLEQRYIELLERRIAALEDSLQVQSSEEEVIRLHYLTFHVSGCQLFIQTQGLQST